MDYSKPSLADALAAQYVAGTLRGRAKRRFETLLAAHPALRSAVRSWQDRLMPLTGVIATENPPPGVWYAIEQRLWPQTAPAPAAWWQRLGLWRALAGFTSAVALGLAMLLASPPPAQAPIVIVLQGTGQGPLASGTFVASLSADGRALTTRPVQPVALQADRALELWAVPPEGAPRSLGVISANGTTIVQRKLLPQSLLKGDTAALAVTVEPPGGSPTGKATGPIVYVGKLQL
ncbi:anti-sigma factor [Ideonella sp. BN130291]|uniref:anti-sigma factor n=1 Tax=Ideonella sp. BN130291 TaxID=3112940 RepID=UPI002E27468C|nr:anti-sigma factor [Ideonella sp. BN130291]